jgi:predicted ATPase
LDLAQKHTLPSYQGWGRFYRGWARARQGHPEQGLTEMRAGLEQLQSTGTQGSIPMLLTLLAETYAQTGAIQAGKTTIDRALVLAEETDARSYLAEMHRVRGLLHLREQATNEAEASFEHAIDIAQSQAARLWELRATMDLCRLQGSKGQVERARSRLAELYDWFSEGFDLPDLQEADALLDALTDAHVEDCEGR